jgi:hypothetical protein
VALRLLSLSRFELTFVWKKYEMGVLSKNGYQAIATQPEYGTSEPAANTEVWTIGAKRSLN